MEDFFCRKFEQMINLGTETVKNSLVQPSGVTVFVPLDAAFQKVANIRWANLNSNQTLVDMVRMIPMSLYKIH